MSEGSLQQLLMRELNALLHRQDLPAVYFEDLGFIQDSFVDYGDRPAVPVSTIRTGAEALELFASLTERKPAHVYANLIFTDTGHGIVSLRASADTSTQRPAIDVSLEQRLFDLTDDRYQFASGSSETTEPETGLPGTHEMLGSGEMVVDLGSVAVSVSVLTGAVTGALSAWLIESSALITGAAMLAGGVLGFVGGRLVAGARYRTGGGHVSVVRKGRSSLPSTLSAAGLSVVAVASLLVLVSLLLGLGAEAWLVCAIAIGCGLVLGTGFACLSSLA